MQEESTGVEVDRDRRKVVEGAEHDGRRPKTKESERYVSTNASRRDRGPGGHRGKEEASGSVGGERERQGDGDGVVYEGNRCRTDGATSGARHDSKRVGTKPLAENESSQHERWNHERAHVPEPSTPPPEYHRRPTDQPNPPRRRGRIKTRPRSVSTSRRAYQATRSRRGHIRRTRAIGYVVYGQEMAQELSRGAERKDEAAGIDRGRARALGQQRDISRAATCHIGQSLERSALPPRVGKIPFPPDIIRTVTSLVYQ